MQRRYVDFKRILDNPAQYTNKWVQSTARLKSGSYYSTQSGGGKYLFDLMTPDGQNVKLALWEAPPSWLPYPETSECLLKMVHGKEEEDQQILRLFQPGETVFFEGYLIFQNGMSWINIERILIASPDTAIGPREIIGMMSCPRKYYLEYVKNVGGNILKRPNKNITRGNLIHEILEKVACDGSLQSLPSCTYGEKKDQIRKYLDDQLNGKYRMDAALHVLADTPLFDVEKDVINRLTSAFGDEELPSLFSNGTIRTEWRINQISGFSGVIDFLVDGHPVELKTATRVFPDHILQLKVYLVTTRLEFGIDDGYLIYPTRTAANYGDESSKIHPITLTNDDIDQVIFARHRVLLQRNGIILPDPLRENCADCRYQTESEHMLRKVWPACQYYCQTERHWNCYEIDNVGVITTECPLLDDCPVRLQYFDIDKIDHFNQLRQAILAENKEQSRLAYLLREKPKEILRACGQQINDLQLDFVEKENLHFKSTESIPCLDFATGDQVIVSTIDGLRYPGTYIWSGGNSVTIRFSGRFHETFIETGAMYTLTRDYHENRSMRSLLKVIDFIQRGIHRSVPTYSKDKISEKQNLIPYSPEAVADSLANCPLNAIQTTHQSSVVQQCSDIISLLPKPRRILMVFRDSVEINDFVQRYPVKHEILIIDRDHNFDPGAQSYTISEKNTPEEIAEKIQLSPIIVTRKGFLQTSIFFEMLNFTDRRVPFDYVIATSAEEYHEPQVYYLRHLGNNTLLIGDAYRACSPIRSSEARDLGLDSGPFSQLVRYDSYFISNKFTVFSESFETLPLQITAALAKTSFNVSAREHGGSVTFVHVDGVESGNESVYYTASLKMKPSDGTQYRVVLTPQNDVSLSRLDEMIKKLELERFDHLKEGNRIMIEDVPFVITGYYPLGREPESKENVEVFIEIPVQFSETLEELMYSNDTEAETILKIVQEMEPKDRSRCVVITPFISQSSHIKSLFYLNDLSDVPVLLPYQAGRTSHDIVIVSFVCAGDERILRYPLTRPEVLYTILTSATEQLILVGSQETIRQSRIMKEIIDSPETKRR